MRVLVVNAGSSSLKLRLLGDDDRVVLAEDLGGEKGVFDWARVEGIVVPVAEQVDAVGHRVVHGGDRFTGPARLTPDVERALAELVDLAPLHQEAALAGIDAMARLLPAVPQVASFDTAFHRTMPAEASTYAVPLEWRTRFGLRRFGFHGLSHAYASRRAAQLLDRPVESLRLATCHLGSGASVAAVASGRSVDTTMGFTPLEGLVMATRSGSVDPGMLLWLIRDRGLSVEEVGEALEHRSGLAALAGTADMAAVVEAAGAGDELAELALAVYVHHLGAAVAAMAAAMGGRRRDHFHRWGRGEQRRGPGEGGAQARVPRHRDRRGGKPRPHSGRGPERARVDGEGGRAPRTRGPPDRRRGEGHLGE